MSRIIELNNGQIIPTIALGTYKAESGLVEQAIQNAIDAGYRYFDCAWINGNEEEVGRGIHIKMCQGIVKREELFISSKLWNNFHKRELVVPMLIESLRALNLDYLDLYLIHWPTGFKENSGTLPIAEGAQAYSDVDYVETWHGMEDCVRLGLTKSIGLANFNSEQIDRILSHCEIKPVVNQIECHPNMNQKPMIEFCKQRRITVVAYFPFGFSYTTSAPGFPEQNVSDPKIKEIAKKHNKTPGQVVLNYLINLGVAVILKCLSKIRIVEYINIYDFQLDSEDIKYLDSCNTNNRICCFSGFADHEFYPFNLDF